MRHRQASHHNRAMQTSLPQPDSRQAWWRLLATLLLMTIGSAGMYVVSVMLPAVQADFGVSRAEASLPYTLLMIGFGLGCVLMTRATRHLSSGEIGLYSLLENVAAPVWVWIGVNERPQDIALVGGVVVIAALAANEWLGMRDGRANTAVSEPK